MYYIIHKSNDNDRNEFGYQIVDFKQLGKEDHHQVLGNACNDHGRVIFEKPCYKAAFCLSRIIPPCPEIIEQEIIDDRNFRSDYSGKNIMQPCKSEKILHTKVHNCAASAHDAEFYKSLEMISEQSLNK